MATTTKAKAAASASATSHSNKLNLVFGMVEIPIRYKPIADSKAGGVPAKMMCATHHSTLNNGPRICSRGTADEHTVESADVVKGYPHPDNPKDLVIVDPSVLEEYAESRTGEAQITKIVDDEIDPGWYDKTYLVEAAGDTPSGAARFDLFTTVLREGNKAAIVAAVFSKQTRTVVFRWSDEFECLLAHVCRFESQIRLANVEIVNATAARRTKPSEEELGLARQILSSLEGEFDPTEVQDTWTPAVQDAIRQVAGGKPVKAGAAAAKPVAPASDLLADLKASVAAVKSPAKKPAAKKPAAKPRAKQPA